MILVIDNYDSFVHNVARYFSVLGETTRVVRNDALSVAQIRSLRPMAIVISPGPGTPAEAGVSCAVIAALSGEVPIFGVCLGHQCIGTVFGGTVARAKNPMHGRASSISHQGARLFAGLPAPMTVGRYHSLIVETAGSVYDDLIVDAASEEGEIMALSHRIHPTYGVQFHPESILTQNGEALFKNFLMLAEAWSADALV
ncbi:aminodeoxychorismate/anthranilate synthase component II [Beijerinckia sp. L45]|uniref:anthranilate synthase component II n=1 Tax=Beijerinckia sp. L45 TaxID=1641855 RepID=UPI00131BD027|nr:aminodeoxychorismate/anthranilate synthase component II [Beijerinckia sp. L45]